MTATLNAAPDVKLDLDPGFELDLAFEPPGRAARVPAPRRRRLPAWWPMLTLGGAIALWIVTLVKLDPANVGAYGLVDALPWTFYAALAVITVGFVTALHRESKLPVMLAHIALAILVIHATPALTYGALRYSWAWKHVGIVDLLHRHHVLVPSTPVLPIYQQWPGFFGAATALTESAGLKSALSYAAWAPPVFELLDALLLAVVLRALTEDRRRIALGVWLFVIANWVGQDYFAPQAFGFFLFLVAFAIVLRWYRRPVAVSARRKARQAQGALSEPATPEVAPARLGRAERRTVGALFLVLMAATVTSHPLTPFVICACLALLMFFRVLDRRWPVIAAFGLTGIWLVTGARSYTFGNLSALLSGFGALSTNFSSNLANLGQLSAAQHRVADLGRLVVGVMALLAIAGLVRRRRLGHVDRAALIMCIAPAAILAGGNYGGEAIFRVYLFALPFAGFLAAGFFFTEGGSKVGWRTPLAIVLVSGVLIGGFTFAYYGKETWSYFTPGEVRAATMVSEIAPPGSLLVDGTLSYPVQFDNAEHFTYVTLGTEPPQSVNQVLRDPAGVLHGWLSDTRYTQGYLIITRSQIAEVDSVGGLPRGSLQRIERLILASHQFKVLYHDADALLVTVPRTGS
ncbi:MAG TPA: hypothetical protein VH914_12990 [Acidimicrobiia bacterium]|nr:hypothetical protein [Acidimicrobiia bacterium]